MDIFHPWSFDALFAKAVVYLERMDDCEPTDWAYGLWSAIGLEFLARAALAKIAPVLLADGRDWNNILHALGRAPTAKKFVPVSISTREVISRLSQVVGDFDEDASNFCVQHTERRNSELHSGDMPFAAGKPSEWLPRFYAICDVLLRHVGKSLADITSDVAGAQHLIDASKDAAAKSVDKDIKAHAQVWGNKSDSVKSAGIAQANAWATRQAGHRVLCPACKCGALLQGKPKGVVTTVVGEDEVIQRQSMMPASFQCVACGLQITGFAKLNACGLGDMFTATSRFTAAEYFNLYTESDLDDARQEGQRGLRYEEDNNE